jgi:Tfp pilus assembly PilM family ATPase
MSVFSSLHDSSGPTVAVELTAHQVSAASLEIRGGAPIVAAHAIEPLPEGALVPSLTTANIHNRQAVLNALVHVLERTGNPRRIGLIVPDLVGKVSLVRFEQVPARAAELDQLVRWQVRKTAPFPIEEAQVSFVPGLRAPGGEVGDIGDIANAGQEFVVSLARRAVVEEYEALCADAGAHAGIVDLATFNVINTVLASTRFAGGDEDWLLVNVAPDDASIAILRGPHLIFFRNRAAETEGTLADFVHQAAMYYEDRLQGSGFGRVFLTGAAGGGPRHAADAEQVRRSLQARLMTPIETVDPRAAAGLTDRISAAPALLDTLAPLVGLLLRGRDAA